MHEPYEARRFEREEKKGSVHYGWRSFVRALNENRTRGLPFRRRTLYPLSYKGVASFSRLGLTVCVQLVVAGLVTMIFRV